MSFNKVVGQANAKRVLKSMVDSNRMPHALLLLGPKGSGGLPLALAFAQYVLCEAPTESDACGVCNACGKTTKYIHPDLHFSYPVVKLKTTPPVSTDFVKEWRASLAQNVYMNVNQWLEKLGAENKLGNITAEECNKILQKLSLKIFEGKKKILLMWLPEYLGKEGNRLLKMIEEPPDDTLFILVAENQEAILNTILSRCQLVKVHPLTDEEVTEGLVEEGIPKEEAQAIAHLTDGDLNEALQLSKQEENDNATRFLEWMRLCYKGNGVELMAWVEKFAPIGREKQKLFIQYGLHFMREILFLKMTQNQDLRLRNNELDTALKMNKVIALDKIEPIAQLFDETAYFVERNANPKILFLDASIQMNQFLRK